jgi:hypothetical protein
MTAALNLPEWRASLSWKLLCDDTSLAHLVDELILAEVNFSSLHRELFNFNLELVHYA